MDFDAVLAQIREQLAREKRIAYRILKRRFQLTDEDIEDLKADLIDAKQLAIDENGKVLVWAGGEVSSREGEFQEKAVVPPPFVADQSLRSSAPEAERRQLTVMFCDLVGSTTLSEQLDPEELREVVRSYQQTSAQVIEQYEGHIAQYLGDGLLVYFGYPAAHEDDAARAIRVGLGIVDALAALNTRSIHALQVRIGIHTGPVVVGEMGGGHKQEQLALGETPNIAARVQGKAQPDTVVVSTNTYRLVQGLFECEELGAHTLRGISTPLALYRVLGGSVVQSRFEVAAKRGLTPLVGRELELGFLQERWERAKAGEGHGVLLCGEPGIGKSRLAREMREHVEQNGTAHLAFHCSPYHQNSAFYPIIEYLEQLLQFRNTDSSEEKLEKLQKILAPYRFPHSDTLALLAALLSLPQPERAAPLHLSPQRQKQRILETLLTWFLEEAEQQAVLMVWEDLHWADPSTLEFLGMFLEQIPSASILTLLTYRPEFAPPWPVRSYMTQFTLSRLGHQQIETMVATIAAGTVLPVEVIGQVVQKTDGIPLFVEECTKMVVESDWMQETDQHSERTQARPELAIPATLQDSLMARLDRLGMAKEIAQLGATIGREFSYELLSAIAPFDETRLQHGLSQLVEAELVYQRGLPPDARYVFKHALVQDTAYQSLLKSKRQSMHQRLAKVLEDQFPDIAATQPELLSQHYTKAGQYAQAVCYWQKAGQQAIERSALVEAVHYLQQGIDVLENLPTTPERAQQELTLQLSLGVPLMALKGYSTPEVGDAYSRAIELCQHVGETPELFVALRGLFEFTIGEADYIQARNLGEQCLSLAQHLQDSGSLLEAHFTLGITFLGLGEFVPALEHLEKGIALYDPQLHAQHAALYGQDPGVTCRGLAAWALAALGYPAQARLRLGEALTLAEQVAHPHTHAASLMVAAFIMTQPFGSIQDTQSYAEAAIRIATEQGFEHWLSIGTILQGWTLASLGQTEAGVAQIREGLEAHAHTGGKFLETYYLLLLADAYRQAGQTEEGFAVVTEALEKASQTRERRCEAELYRLKGELLLNDECRMMNDERQTRQTGAIEPAVEAEACFQHAIEIARRQQAKSLELRAATSLARLWQQQDKSAEAHTLLSEVYHWFSEGFDTKDLKEARALLDVLA